MLKNNVYKPRYKTAFQAKTKTWPYKNSRLRRFFNIRGRKIVRRGLFKRYVLVFNNMKWTFARRFIKPFMKRRRANRQKFRNVFYSKQQLRAFYGIQKEVVFRNFFKRFLGGAKSRNNLFATALERRADMFLFRLRFLPTIYACHQFIHYFGLYINGKKETAPAALMRPGDVVTFKKEHWFPFVEYLIERLHWRVVGLNLWKKRQFNAMRKKIRWISRNKTFKRSNVFLIKKFTVMLKKLLKINKKFGKVLPKIHKRFKHVFKYLKISGNIDKLPEYELLKNDFDADWKNYQVDSQNLIKKITRISKKKWRLRMWFLRGYYSLFFIWMTHILQFYQLIRAYKLKMLRTKFNLEMRYVALSPKLDLQKDMDLCKQLKKDAVLTVENKIAEYYPLVRKINQMSRDAKKRIQLNLIYKKYLRRFFYFGIINKKYKFLAAKGYRNIRALLLRKRAQNIDALITLQKKIFFKKRIWKKWPDMMEALQDARKDYDVKVDTFLAERKAYIKKFNDLLASMDTIWEENSNLYSKKIELFVDCVLKRRIKRYIPLKPRLRTDWKTKETYKVNPRKQLLYYLIKRKKSKVRRYKVVRLNKVHWYIPAYIYFDYRTLRAVFLYNPKPEEIVYSFKCSLRRMHSFYKALGL